MFIVYTQFTNIAAGHNISWRTSGWRPMIYYKTLHRIYILCLGLLSKDQNTCCRSVLGLKILMFPRRAHCDWRVQLCLSVSLHTATGMYTCL